MAHRSWCAEHPGTLSNERLEFLGDAVLGWVVADLAYRRFSDLPEGDLTGSARASSTRCPGRRRRAIGLGEFLLLGRGEDAAGGREKPSILSDALEAVFGAVYVDGGPAAAYDVIERLIGPRLAPPPLVSTTSTTSRGCRSWRRGGAARRSTSRASEGPDHAKHFFATVVVDGAALGEGAGRSKKAAEQAAPPRPARPLAAPPAPS